MSGTGRNKPTHKESQVGWIPHDWTTKRAADLVVPSAPIRYGVVQLGADTEGGVPIIPIKFVKKIAHSRLHRAATDVERPYANSRVQAGDVLISVKGTIGRVGVVPPGFSGNIARELARLRIAKNHSPEFVAYQFEAEHTQKRISKSVVGSTRLEFSIAALRNFHIAVPGSVLEERKIAEILMTWDDALTQLDALIEAKERRKKALMQQLLTGLKRFSGFQSKWQRVRLGDVLLPISRPTAKPRGAFLAAGVRSHGKGVFLKPDFAPANIALEELFELKAGDLVVNITFAWEGAAAIVPAEADGALVSHRFPAFGFREGEAAASFFRHYIRTKRFVFDCGLASPGGAGRNRVLSKSAFLDIELSLPLIEEQEKIGSTIDAADQEITLLRVQRSTLDQQKRGLMQRLLTGKLRVKL